ncbi:MAG: hypothetical protein J7J27_05415 [Euryarchaeota archaeon]|nr:hypothetical protein [Euryarchaeota archaeon]
MTELFIGTACPSSKSYYIVPRENIRINLERLAKELRENGWTIKKMSKGIVIASKEYTIAIFPTGKILIRDTTDEDIARKIGEEVFPLVLKSKITQS